MPSLGRRQLLVAAGSATLGGCLSDGRTAGDLGSVDGSWSMVGRDAAHTRRVANWPTEPEQVWATTLPDARAAGALALTGGALYVPVDAVSDAARHRYRVHALSAPTGENWWQVPIRAEPNAPPAVAGGRVVVTARRSLERGRVLCFRTDDGGEEWLVDVDARLTAPPTVRDGVAYVPDWRGRVHALSVVDGELLWSRKLAAGGSGRTFTEPVAVHEETLFVGSASGNTGLLALDAETGQDRWRLSTGAVTGGPIVTDDFLLVRSHHRVLAVGLDGSLRWTANVHEPDARPMAVDDDRVYVPAHDTLHAIQHDGRPAWQYGPTDSPVGTPTVAGDSVVVRGESRLTALSRDTGATQWSATPAGTGRAVVTAEAVFLPASDGGVVAFGGA